MNRFFARLIQDDPNSARHGSWGFLLGFNAFFLAVGGLFGWAFVGMWHETATGGELFLPMLFAMIMSLGALSGFVLGLIELVAKISIGFKNRRLRRATC